MPRATPWLPAFLLVLGIGAWKIAESAAPPARHPTTAPATRPWNNSTFADPENAKQIIFMCDASGSMINKFASLKNELNKAILELPPNCTFNILFFQDGKAVMLNRNAMVAATQEGKRAASKLLEEVTTTSTSDPIQGLIAGFRLHPDLIYVLTDGDFPDNDAVIKKVRQLNRPAVAPKAARIHTIAFTNDKDTDTAYLKLLEQIAKENGGSFRHVEEDKLK